MIVSQQKYDLLRLVFNSLDQAIVATDIDGHVGFVNAAYTRLIGHTREEILGRKVSQALPDIGNVRATLANALAVLKRDGAYKEDILVCDKYGEPKWVTMTANVVSEEGQPSKYIVATIADITFTKIHETLQHRLLHDLVRGKSLAAVMDVLCRQVQQMIPGMHMSVSRIDQAGRCWTQAAPDLPIAYLNAIEGISIGPEVGSCGTAAWRGEPVIVSDIHSDPLWREYRHLTRDLDYQSVWSTPIKDSSGAVKGVFAFYSDREITPTAFQRHLLDICSQLCTLAFERSDAQDRIHFLAHRDPLTGLLNRAFFQEKLGAEIRNTTGDHGMFALHLVDLDRFKEVNDRRGHLAGDQLLIDIARELERDAGDRDMVGRLGGDEFVVLQADVQSPDEAMGRARRIAATIKAAVTAHDARLVSGASIGFAMFPRDATDPGELLHDADLALYEAKQAGGGRSCAYDPQMSAEIEYRRGLEDDLRAALIAKDGTLHLAYQPQFSLADEELVGLEALVRWDHPKLGVIAPDVFIPIAEEGGLIVDLGAWVLRTACATAASWPSALTVAVNLSPVQIIDGRLPDLVGAVLAETGLAPERLELEITENVLIRDKDNAVRLLSRLSALGVAIVMDDFGTGYSSLTYLQTFPFDKIKIDRSFVSDLETNPHSRAIIDAVLGLCKAIGMPVIAEGVETQAQLDILRAKKCGFAQGYLLGMPMGKDGVFTGPTMAPTPETRPESAGIAIGGSS